VIGARSRGGPAEDQQATSVVTVREPICLVFYIYCRTIERRTYFEEMRCRFDRAARCRHRTIPLLWWRRRMASDRFGYSLTTASEEAAEITGVPSIAIG
jgi:hypothetical protein